MGKLPDVDFAQLWPLILTVIGVGKLVAPGEDGRWGGVSLILAAMALFGLPMQGSWIALNVVLGIFLVGAIGTGLLVSTIAETQQVAFQIGSLVAFLPTFILSGFIFPIASMPIGLQYVSTVVPARYFLIALRGIVLKGSDLATVWPSVAALVVYAFVVMALASLRLAKR